MAKIVLTPDELRAQSQEMKNLKAQYESLFSSVQGILVTTNQSWSENLANNFEGKIRTAQESFLKINSMLQGGADIADMSANTFKSVDSILAQLTNGNTADVGNAVTQVGVNGTFPEGMIGTEDIPAIAAGMALSDIVDILNGETKHLGWGYDEIKNASELGYDIIKTATKENEIFETFWDASDIGHDILTGEVGWGTLKNVASVVGLGSPTVKTTLSTFDLVTGEDSYYTQRMSYWEGKMTEEIKQGDFLTTGLYMAASFVDVIGKGAVEVAGGVIDSMIPVKPSTVINVVDSVFGTEISEGLDSFGAAIGDNFSETVEGAVDLYADAVDAGGKLVTDAFNGAKDFISSWF